MRNLNIANVATVLVLIYAAIGALLVLLSAVLTDMDPSLKLSFKSYLEQMAIAVAGLAIGRGLNSGLKGGRR